MENGTYEQIVTHLGWDLELNTVSQQPTNTNADRPKPTCHQSKKPGNYRNRCRLLEKQREQTENIRKKPGNKNSDANNSNPNSNINNNNNNCNKNKNRAERKPKNVYTPLGKSNHSREKCYFGANAANRPPPRHRRPETQNQVPERANQSDANETSRAASQNLTKMPRIQSGAATERPEITHLTFPPIQEVVWLQPQETHVTNIQKTLTTETHKITYMPESKQRNEVESHRLPMKETSSQVSGSSTERHLGNQTGSTRVQSLIDSKKPHLNSNDMK